MKKLFYLLLMLFMAYACFWGYREYKARVDSMLVTKILKTNTQHQNKVTKISNSIKNIKRKKTQIKNEEDEIQKKLKKISEENEPKVEVENHNKNTELRSTSSSVNSTKNEKENDSKFSEKELKDKLEKLKIRLKPLENLLKSAEEVETRLEEKSSEFYNFLKKCQLNFISSKLKKEVTTFLLNYEENENELDKQVEKIVLSCELLEKKDNSNSKEEEKGLKDDKKEDNIKIKR